MKFVIDEFPKFCPGCGCSNLLQTPMNKAYLLKDFSLGVSFRCNCGTEYQFVPTTDIIQIATKHGDAGQYWRQKL
jgi:hypothetical protein